jgi:AAA15 family ATPase/GTPase
LVFERAFDTNVEKIEFHNDYCKTDKDKLFIEILSEKLIRQNELLITFLSKNYPEDFKIVRTALDWFERDLTIITPNSKPIGIAHKLDKDDAIMTFVNKFITSLNTGISGINVDKKSLEEFFSYNDVKLKSTIIENMKNSLNNVVTFKHKETGEEITVVNENGEIIVKRLIAKHLNNLGNCIDFDLRQESDGTNRLIDLIPAFYFVLNKEKVYIVDEIEQSIHPLTIKEIITKISLDENMKGQLIFSTHESNLLDQSILRPDEIWLAQKDIDGSSKIYSLSDFKIHNTINIENGYLKGRFGGIPFLGNLKDLNW